LTDLKSMPIHLPYYTTMGCWLQGSNWDLRRICSRTELDGSADCGWSLHIWGLIL